MMAAVAGQEGKPGNPYMEFETMDDVHIDTADGNTLDEEDLFEAKSALLPIAARWKDVGIALRLKPSSLDAIETSHSASSNKCLSEMLTLWLRKNYNTGRFGEPTWQRLVEAVMDPAGGANPALASKISGNHSVKTRSSSIACISTSRNKSLACQRESFESYYVGPVEPDALVQDIMSWRMSWMASFENWYHGKISRSEVEEKLRISPDGSFLVRESATYPGSYALSTKHQGQIKHRIVHSTRGDSGSSYQLKGSGKCFHKITDLVMYYRNNYISTDGEILRTPCSRSTPNEVHARRFPVCEQTVESTLAPMQLVKLTSTLADPSRRRAGPPERYKSSPDPSTSTAELQEATLEPQQQLSERFLLHSQGLQQKQHLDLTFEDTATSTPSANAPLHTPPEMKLRPVPKKRSGHVTRYQSNPYPLYLIIPQDQHGREMNSQPEQSPPKSPPSLTFQHRLVPDQDLYRENEKVLLLDTTQHPLSSLSLTQLLNMRGSHNANRTLLSQALIHVAINVKCPHLQWHRQSLTEA